MASIYKASGTLVDGIAPENVAKAQAFLQEEDMTQYLWDTTEVERSLKAAVIRWQWTLSGDGHTWVVEAITHRDLTEAELKELASQTSGQNSDGLGSSFEQQPWAWVEGEDEDRWSEDEEPEGHMCSFDWETNECEFTRVA